MSANPNSWRNNFLVAMATLSSLGVVLGMFIGHQIGDSLAPALMLGALGAAISTAL